MGGSYSNKPVENTSDTWYIELDTNTGRAQYSLLLTAYLNNQKVKFTGTDVIDPSSGYQEVRNIEIIIEE